MQTAHASAKGLIPNPDRLAESEAAAEMLPSMPILSGASAAESAAFIEALTEALAAALAEAEALAEAASEAPRLAIADIGNSPSSAFRLGIAPGASKLMFMFILIFASAAKRAMRFARVKGGTVNEGSESDAMALSAKDRLAMAPGRPRFTPSAVARLAMA